MFDLDIVTCHTITIVTPKLFVIYILILYFFLCSKTMNLPKTNDSLIDLKDGHLSMSVNSSKNSCEMLTKIGSGNKVVTLSYKSWNFGPICARYSSNGCRVWSSLNLRFAKLRRKAIHKLQRHLIFVKTTYFLYSIKSRTNRFSSPW